MSEALHTRGDRALAARIAFYEERPWVRPNVERWIESGVDTDGDLGPLDVMAKMIALYRIAAERRIEEERMEVVEVLAGSVRDAYESPKGTVSPTGLRAPTRSQLALVGGALRAWDAYLELCK